MANEIENNDSPNVETDDQIVETTPEEKESLDEAALKEKLAKTESANRQLFERAKRAEGFVFDKESKRWVKPEKPEPKVETTKVEPKATTGELDETQLDFLELKGVTEDDDLSVIKSVMTRTGQTLRQTLKDEYVVSKLEANKKQREVQNAMPSSSKRSGGGELNNVDYWVAENEKSGKLPDDFELRKKVIEAKVAQSSDTTPPWRR